MRRIRLPRETRGDLGRKIIRRAGEHILRILRGDPKVEEDRQDLSVFILMKAREEDILRLDILMADAAFMHRRERLSEGDKDSLRLDATKRAFRKPLSQRLAAIKGHHKKGAPLMPAMIFELDHRWMAHARDKPHFTERGLTRGIIRGRPTKELQRDDMIGHLKIEGAIDIGRSPRAEMTIDAIAPSHDLPIAEDGRLTFWRSLGASKRKSLKQRPAEGPGIRV